MTRTSVLHVLTAITIAPITSTIRNIPTYVPLTPEEDGIPALCAVNLDNLQTIQKQQIGSLITTLSGSRMQEVERAICFALGLDQFLD